MAVTPSEGAPADVVELDFNVNVAASRRMREGASNWLR
jgi:hypothetical protein